MRAFIQRRLAPIAEGIGNVIILGSPYSANTLRLREFLTRNGHPHTYVDLDRDAPAQELLDRFKVTIDEIPVVICGGKAVQRNPTTQQLAGCWDSQAQPMNHAFMMSPSWALVLPGWQRQFTLLLKA